MRYTTEQLEEMGFEVAEDGTLTVAGDWVDQVLELGSIVMSVEYTFHADGPEPGLWDIDDDHYAFSARVISVDSWQGKGPTPFSVGEVFDPLDQVTFSSCKG